VDSIRETFTSGAGEFARQFRKWVRMGNFPAAKYRVDIILDAEAGSARMGDPLNGGFSG
jgi:hypothetical protein